MTKKETDPQIILNFLEDKYETWYSCKDKKKRDFIEECVYNYLQFIDDSIYIEVMDGRASGLCSYPYFEEDLRKLINILNQRINKI